MPKKEKVSVVEMREWLRRHELGDTIQKIAKDAKRDTRTVIKYLGQARKKNDLHTARQNLLTQVLTRHNNELLKVVTNITQALEVPGPDVEMRQGDKGNWLDIPLIASRGIHTPKGVRIELHDEDSVSWQLLDEHMGVESPLDRISTWKKVVGEYLETMKRFKLFMLITMRTKAGLDVIKETDDKPTKSVLFTAVGDILFPIFVNRAMAVPDGTDPEHNLKLDKEGYVSLHGMGTHLGWVSQKGSSTVDTMKETLVQLGQSQEFRHLKFRYLNARKVTKELRDEFEEINLLGYIAGRCRACERLEE